MCEILKCPYCDGILEQSSIYNINSYACTDLACKGYFMTATKDMWQELIRTRKALDRAKWWLKEIVENHRYTPISTAEMALKEITALEQKDKQ